MLQRPTTLLLTLVLLFGALMATLLGLDTEKETDRLLTQVVGVMEESGVFEELEEVPVDAVALPEREGIFQVVRIVDGDTFVAENATTKETIRFIGVDTPESVHPQREVECFAEEATEYLSLLIENQTVRIETDSTQSTRDRYGRLLAYVYRLGDGLNVGEALLEEGYAYEYLYRDPYQLRERFVAAEERARSEKRGLWQEGVCAVSSEKPLVQ